MLIKDITVERAETEHLSPNMSKAVNIKSQTNIAGQKPKLKTIEKYSYSALIQIISSETQLVLNAARRSALMEQILRKFTKIIN